MGLYIWETILSETLTKMNVNRRNWFCCLVLMYCDQRIWIAIDENGWQSTKLNDSVSNIIDRPKTKLKQAFALSRVSETKLKTLFFLNWMTRWRKWAGKTYRQKSSIFTGGGGGGVPQALTPAYIATIWNCASFAHWIRQKRRQCTILRIFSICHLS